MISFAEAIEEARVAYARLHEAASTTADPEMRAYVDRMYARGQASLDAHSERTGGLALSDTGADAFRAYMNAASPDDLDAQIAWLSMLPEVVAEVGGTAVAAVDSQDAPRRHKTFFLDEIAVLGVGAFGSSLVNAKTFARTFTFVVESVDQGRAATAVVVTTGRRPEPDPDPDHNPRRTLALAA